MKNDFIKKKFSGEQNDFAAKVFVFVFFLKPLEAVSLNSTRNDGVWSLKPSTSQVDAPVLDFFFFSL